MKIPSIKLNTINLAEEQMQMIRKNMFTSEYDKFFSRIKSNSLNSNIYLFGYMTDKYAKNGLDEFQIKTVLGGIRRLLNKKPEPDNINLINIMYSTLIKRIIPKNLIEGKILPDTYRRIIKESIKMYKEYPLNEGIDYRHILGRMVSLKNMNTEIRKRLNWIPQEMEAIEWTKYDQLELVYTMERIFSQYKTTNSNFIYKRSKKRLQHNDIINLDTIKHNYYNNIIRLLWMLLDNSLIMLRNAELNVEEIKYNIDLVSYFSYKIPLNDLSRMTEVWKIQAEFKKINKELNKKTGTPL